MLADKKSSQLFLVDAPVSQGGVEAAPAWRRNDPSPALAAFLTLTREVASKTEGLEAEPVADRPRGVVLST